MPLQGKVKGSFAVVKKSSDPHNDFRTSMVEMIVEKQIFSAKDLEHLLQCFLSLNLHHHHKEEVQFLMNPAVNRHPNLVILIGYCCEKEVRGVVYDLNPKNTLHNLTLAVTYLHSKIYTIF
ncbi:hypothetical protein FEM48_Zijuj01G0177300 [Ziziphus jujuba var. spinosa]|uniref:Transcription repressor n=1 Tax=Ziziphus jujuba var. spinosa TaxID=714518 RepID=A0A978W2N5_ZIZJJ|nr:hypothetical protein FEM48_Zijuj01G0177300 [Ziziphus jujuba var. spinosa]